MLSGAKINESGRSMVEMLGVLAIVGVLSVGGIAGYSKAMAKFKLTKAQDQITMTLMNVRTAYASSPTYNGLDNATAAKFNLVSADMIADADGGELNGAFGGAVTVSACGESDCTDVGAEGDGYFYIKMEGLTADACMSMLTADWGSDGMMGMIIGDEGKKSSELPLSMDAADGLCYPEGENKATPDITWVYY